MLYYKYARSCLLLNIFFSLEMDSSSEKENINNPPSNQSCSSSDGEVLEKTRVNDCNPGDSFNIIRSL